jgi:hypothetical protein
MALCGVVFARRCAAVVFVALGGGRLRAALHRRCLRAVLCGRRSAVLSSRSVMQLLSLRGVAWQCLRVARGSSLCGRRLHVPLHGGCCLRVAVVVAALSSAWSRSSSPPVAKQSRAEGAHTFLCPANDGRAAQGWGINGATAIPLRRHGPCSRTNGEQGAKRGVPWAKRGASAFNRGRGQSKGSHTFCAPANGGGCAGAGRNAPALAQILFAHERGAQKGAGATQRKGVKGAAALPLHDSGTNPVRAQTGGRVQKGGGLVCNKGAGAGGIMYLPALRKGGIREGPVRA